MQGYLDHAKSRPRFLPTMSVPPRQKRTPEGVQRHTKNVSSNFNSMVLALRLLYGAVKTLHIWHHLADFANIMSFMQLVIWVIPHCVIIRLYVHSVIISVRVGFNARCWSAFGTHDAGPGRHCFLLSSFTALRDRSRCEYQGPGDIEVSTLDYETSTLDPFLPEDGVQLMTLTLTNVWTVLTRLSHVFSCCDMLHFSPLPSTPYRK